MQLILRLGDGNLIQPQYSTALSKCKTTCTVELEGWMEHPGTTSTIIAAHQAGKDNPK